MINCESFSHVCFATSPIPRSWAYLGLPGKFGLWAQIRLKKIPARAVFRFQNEIRLHSALGVSDRKCLLQAFCIRLFSTVREYSI